MHGLLEVDGVENFDAVVVALKEPAHLADHRPLGVCDHIGRVALHEVGLDPEAGLTRTGAAHDEDILIARVFRVFGTVGHHKAFRLGENHIVLKDRIDEWCDILPCTPTGAAILLAVTILLGVLTFEIDRQTQHRTAGSTEEKIVRLKAGPWGCECHRQSLHDVERLGGKVKARSKACGLSELCGI